MPIVKHSILIQDPRHTQSSVLQFRTDLQRDGKNLGLVFAPPFGNPFESTRMIRVRTGDRNKLDRHAVVLPTVGQVGDEAGAGQRHRRSLPKFVRVESADADKLGVKFPGVFAWPERAEKLDRAVGRGPGVCRRVGNGVGAGVDPRIGLGGLLRDGDRLGRGRGAHVL